MAVNRKDIEKELDRQMEQGPEGFDRGSVEGQIADEPPGPEPPSAMEQIGFRGRNISTAIVQGLALPFDIMHGIENAIVEVTGIEPGLERAESPGSRAQTAGSELGATFAPGEEPQDIGSRAERFVTFGLLPFGPAQRIATVPRFAEEISSSGVRQFAQPTGTGQAVAQGILRETAEHPGRFVAGETAAGIAAPVGGEIAADQAREGNIPVDELTARAFGELVAGLGVGSIVPGTTEAAKATGKAGLKIGEKLPLTGQAIKWVRNNISAIDAGRRRVGEFVDDPRAAATAAAAGDPRLSPGERTGEPGVAQLQRAAEETSPSLRRREGERRRRVAGEMEEETVGTFEAPEAARNFLQRRVQAAIRNMDRRMNQLKGRAEPEEEAKIVASEIEDAHKTVRQRERQEWEKIDVEQDVNISQVHQNYSQVIADEPAADQLPGFVKAKLGRFTENAEGEQVFEPGQLGTDPSFEQLKTLRSQILRTERSMLRSGEADRNQLRLLGQIDDMLLDSMRTVDSEQVDRAIGLSRLANQTFREGTVGQLMRSRIARRPTTTLEKTVTGSPAERAENIRDVLRAAEQSGPEALERTRRSVGEYLKTAFVTQVDPDGSGIPNPKAVNRFLQQNRVVLEDFPELAQKMRNAKAARELVKQRTGEVNQNLLPFQRRKSAAALYLEADPGREIAKVTDPRSGIDPEAGFRELMTEVRPGGKPAMSGLKGSFVQHLFDVSRVKASGDFPMSGDAYLSELERIGPAAVKAGMISQDQLQRLRTVGRNLQSMERVQSGPSAEGGVSGGQGLGNFLRTALGMSGAAAGRRVADVTGSRATIQFAQRGSRFAEEAGRGRLVDRSEQMIIKAVLEDPKLFRQITTDLPSASDRTRQRIERAVRPFFTTGIAAEQVREREAQGGQ